MKQVNLGLKLLLLLRIEERRDLAVEVVGDSQLLIMLGTPNERVAGKATLRDCLTAKRIALLAHKATGESR